MSAIVSAMTIEDHAEVVAVWNATAGIVQSASDSRDGIEMFLTRNPGFSAVARSTDGSLVGAVLCGHDGRRGAIYHLAVAIAFRRQGVAKALMEWCFTRLAAAGILRCNLHVLTDNVSGAEFWAHNGWKPPGVEVRLLQRNVRHDGGGDFWSRSSPTRR